MQTWGLFFFRRDEISPCKSSPVQAGVADVLAAFEVPPTNCPSSPPRPPDFAGCACACLFMPPMMTGSSASAPAAVLREVKTSHFVATNRFDIDSFLKVFNLRQSKLPFRAPYLLAILGMPHQH